ncbi:hypothetical protein HID58_044952 [Brassica napus]|uniref:Uncharacterized protein n=2 Tax=Brassica TaxID=3705 RepID=A0ABQ7X5E0_BRANA|nr:hypothetical protein HID58_091115 [Brassica napus]KAH0895384.1 hypothetical protein HID58_044952 [Brassica napus]CAG7891124.1 unnamed protein product [Brassica rapa]VDC84573.1 unnamed protein product [Brassica rapa]
MESFTILKQLACKMQILLVTYTDYVLAPKFANDMVNLDNYLEEYVKVTVNATVCTGIQKQVEAFRSGFHKVRSFLFSYFFPI